MTTYNTGNPLGSTDPRDLYDNAENLDNAVNSTDDTWTDRLGITRATLPKLITEYPNAFDDAERAENAALAASADRAQTGLDVLASAQSAVDAESAAVAALAAATTYVSTAAGLAATTSGQVFLVTTADPQVYSVYSNNAGSAVLLGTLNIANGSAFSIGDVVDYEFVIVDDNNRAAIGVKEDGSVRIAELQADTAVGGEYLPDAIDMGGVYLSGIARPGFAFVFEDDTGRAALAVKNNGEVVIGSFTANEASIGDTTIAADQFPYSAEGTKVYAIGDSTVAAFAGGTAIMGLITSTRTEVDLSAPGNTIAQQLTAWNAQTIVGTDVGWVVVQIGLNDVNTTPGSSATAVASLQNLIDVIRSEIGPRRLLVSQMIPCRQRWINSFGPVDGLVAQQNWVDINLAIAGFGPTPITDVDGRITEHVALMADGSGNLKAEYDTGDGIHPNTAGRQVNATQWERAIRRTTVQV